MNEVNIDLDLTKSTPEDLDGLPPMLPAGNFHILVTGVRKHRDDDRVHLRISYTVLAGTDQSAVGMNGREDFALTDNAQWRLRILASRMGLIGAADCGQKKSPNFGEILGREMVVKVIHEEYERKKDNKVMTVSKWDTSGFWSVEDERVEAVPKDRQGAVALRNKIAARQQGGVPAPQGQGQGTPNYPPAAPMPGQTSNSPGGKPSVVGYI